MFTKEECLKELENSRFLTVSVINQDGRVECFSDFEQTTIFDTFKQLIDEHFKLVKQLQDEVDKYKHEYYAMCDLVENPQPYKFEELHKNMYVWVHWFKEDPTKGHPVRITGTGYDDNNNRVVYYQYGDGVGAYDFDAFIFYPLTMALKIPKPIKLTPFEYDLLNAYSYEGTNVPNSRLIDYDFLNDLKMRGHYKNVDMKMTFEDVLRNAVVKDD